MVRKLVIVAGLLLTSCNPPSTAPSPLSVTTTTTEGSSTTTLRFESSAVTSTYRPDPPCQGGTIFEHPPVDLDAVEVLVPFGLMTGSHVTPVDHQYFQNFLEPDREIDVFSPGAGRVVSLQHFGTPVSENPEGVVDDFRLVIEHTCTISSIFIHIDELVPKLAVHDPGIGNHASIDVAMEAGELIGTFNENVDYNLVDLDFTLQGLVDPASYEREPWKIHVPDTFAYFTKDIRDRLEGLSLRSTEPRAGRFAYDVDGRLVGNWFREGTNGYGGVDPDRYWAGHLSFAYDYLDPSLVVVSVGTYEGRSRQFAVRGNTPDPVDVSVDTGLVVYDLVEWDYRAGDHLWDRRSFTTNIQALPGQSVVGAVAVQLIEDRQLLVEVFPDRTTAEVTGFSLDVMTYTR
jgi:hypothetical protein